MKIFTPPQTRQGRGPVEIKMPGDENHVRAKSSGRSREPAPEELVMLAKRVSLARTKRQAFFAGDLFAEPGWEMLLALYAADAAGHRMTISNLSDVSNSPDTTALRWLDKLIELKLVRRMKNPLDARIVFIELEDATRTSVRSYLSDLWVLLYSRA